MVNIEYATTLVNPNLKHLLEFGVGSGHTTRQMKGQVDRLFSDQNLEIIGFDWFNGLPEAWASYKDPRIVAAGVGAFTQNGIAPDIPGVRYYVGLYDETIPQYLAKEAAPIGLLHIDCDLYSSTKTVFDNLHPYIVKDTIIAFDEWCYLHNPNLDDHEARAFYEYVEKYNVKYEFIDFICPEKGVERKIVRIL
jgi:hypothetical protein